MDAGVCRAVHSDQEVVIGLGDELMAAGAARRAQLTDPRRVRILGRNGEARWHHIWAGNPRIARRTETGDFQTLVDAPGCRPYIAGKTDQRWTWREYACTPGEIYLSADERELARRHRPQVVIEPGIKQGASPNKQWGAQQWDKLARLARAAGLQLTQLGPPGSQPMPRVQLIETSDFRVACAVLANAQAYVGPDGGLMHAAAALGIPAVVIRGAYISERCTGYASQRNLFFGEGLGCGMRVPCPCCADAMAAITPEIVLDELKGVLR